MKSPRSKAPKGRTIPAPAKSPLNALPDPLRLSARRGDKGEEIVVWLEGKGPRPRRIGSVNRRLAADARLHGQDLVGDLVDEALREVDRQTPSRPARQ